MKEATMLQPVARSLQVRLLLYAAIGPVRG